VLLNYLGPGVKSGTLAAMRAWAALTGVFPAAPKTSLDEYPFRSTQEGGGFGGIRPEFMYVEPWENSRQGGMLSSFYSGQMSSTPGPFLVVLVP
jgi:hypothetical protein